MKIKESKAMLEVWEWKEAAMEEVEGLDLKTTLKLRLTKAVKTTKELGLDQQNSNLANISSSFTLTDKLMVDDKKF